jgi:hypothetical protein
VVVVLLAIAPAIMLLLRLTQAIQLRLVQVGVEGQIPPVQQVEELKDQTLFLIPLHRLAVATGALHTVMQAAAAAAVVVLGRVMVVLALAVRATHHLHHPVKATMAAQLAIKTTVLAAAAVLVL